jgi:bacterial/archaeal transporter family protein
VPSLNDDTNSFELPFSVPIGCEMLMLNSLSAAILSLISFGLWGLFSKITLQYVDAKNALIYQTIGVLLIGFLTLYLVDFKLTFNSKGISYGLLTGIAYGVGCLLYLIAADKGKISTIVTLTALYPVITILLSYFILQEAITLKQVFGFGFALIAIYFLSN